MKRKLLSAIIVTLLALGLCGCSISGLAEKSDENKVNTQEEVDKNDTASPEDNQQDSESDQNEDQTNADGAEEAD